MNYLVDYPEEATVETIGTFIFAHGAGAPMDSGFMNALTRELNRVGLCVVRFEFPYMQLRRGDGRKRPPNRQPALLECFEQVVRDIHCDGACSKPLLIGGKSMGGRMASLLAVNNDVEVDGVCCFGLPFHPPGKPEKLADRIEHLLRIKTPVQIFQGTRDPFGKQAVIDPIKLSASVKIHWLESGDHDLKPGARSGLTQNQHFQYIADQMAKLCRQPG